MKPRARDLLFVSVTIGMLACALVLSYRAAASSRVLESVLLFAWVAMVIVFVYEQRLRTERDALRNARAKSEALRKSDSRYRGLIECMADAVFSVDLGGRITLANMRASELVGLCEKDLLQTEFASLLAASNREEIKARLQEPGSIEDAWTIETQLFAPPLRMPVPVELKAAALMSDDGEIIGTQWVARDVTERKRFEQELLDMASHDHLTGLMNRRALEGALERELAKSRRTGTEGALVWLDLDDFKDVNDSLGHRAGDTVLYLLSEQLQKQVRESDVLARLGGDEFAILMPDTDIDLAENAAHRILSAINSFTFIIDKQSIRMSASVGVSIFPRDGATADEILANADAAMYEAKARGRGNVKLHGDASGSEHVGNLRIAWNARVENALRQDRFFFCAQPVFNLTTHDVFRYELLLRMHGDNDDVVYMPGEFLPSAERLGLINEIDKWMIRQAIELLQDPDWDGLSVEVNLSGKALVDPTLLGFVSSSLIEAGVDPSRLGFEITETAAIADFTRAQSFMRAMKEMGCRFSLDDFGSGFSSLYYLKHLPIDCVKIDRSFIQELTLSRQDRALVGGIVEMCRGLSIEIVAEGVEDQATLHEVQRLGVGYAQGYHVGRPLRVHGHPLPPAEKTAPPFAAVP